MFRKHNQELAEKYFKIQKTLDLLDVNKQKTEEVWKNNSVSCLTSEEKKKTFETIKEFQKNTFKK